MVTPRIGKVIRPVVISFKMRHSRRRSSPDVFVRHKALMIRYFGLYANAHRGKMRIIASITDYSVVDRFINHLKLSFVAERPPPPQIVYQELLMAAEKSGEYTR
jgi:hypothetical protein